MYGFLVCIICCGNLYGGGDLNFNCIILQMIQFVLNGEVLEICSDGMFVCDYFYIEDVVQVYLFLVEKMEENNFVGEVFNFSNEIQLIVFELVEKILKKMNSDLKLKVLNQGSNEIKY